MSESKDNSGALFRVDKPKSDKHPTHSGPARIKGVDYYVDAWVNEKERPDGSVMKYFKLTFKPKGPTAARGEESQAPSEEPGF